MTATTPMCDKFPERPAVAKFLWAHGEQGFCSSEYQFLLNQTAKNCRQTVTFAPLAPVEAPLTRSERVQLIAGRLAAEGEADETKRRAATLYDQNKELRATVEHLKTAVTEKEAQNQDLQAELGQVGKDRDRYARQAGETALAMEAQAEHIAQAKEADAQIADLRQAVQTSQDTIADLRNELEKK